MRKAVIAVTAVPIIAAVYAGAMFRRTVVSRLVLAISIGGILGAGIIGAGLPAATTARPTTRIVPLTSAAFRTVVATGASVTAPVAIEFTTPMSTGSVAAAVTIDPPTPVDLAWDASDRTLTISPKTTWAPGVFHTVSVQAGALAQTGQPLARPTRAAFLTRPPIATTVATTVPIGKRASVATAFAITFVGPIDPASVKDAIRIEPPTPGKVVASGSPDGPASYAFVPATPLRPNMVYKLVVKGVRDRDGLPVAPQSIAVRTINAPGVVRFRPRDTAEPVALEAAISVRFTESMDRRATARAFSTKIAGKAVKGTISWAESNTVLIFKPATPLPYDAAVVAKVDMTATGATGASLVRSTRVIFKTVAKPAAAPVARLAATTVAKPAATRVSKGGGGAAVGGGSWSAVESYYLGLMNCTRTGGVVTSDGSCSSPGGRKTAPLRIDPDISSQVSRPYARLLATGGDCSHFIGGTPGNRLARAGYSSYQWAENLGCRSGDPNSAVLGSHLFFQSEKSYSGGHYVNLMNGAYDRVGIGVWVSSGQVRLVVDFYHP